MALWVLDHVVRGTPVDDTATIVIGATFARLVTVGVALASVQRWGARLGARLVNAALWACAVAQLAYPLAELLVKIAIALGAVAVPPVGVGNMSATGWFNLAAVWAVFGIPGGLFALSARSHANRYEVRSSWLPLAGGAAGMVGLLGLGALIG